jgi:hypothetical protein
MTVIVTERRSNPIMTDELNATVAYIAIRPSLTGKRHEYRHR